jgi:FPC/CPF motif-containing protein YcgG
MAVDRFIKLLETCQLLRSQYFTTLTMKLPSPTAYSAFDYLRPSRSGSMVIENDTPAPALIQLIHGLLKGMVTSEGFPCLGSKAAFNRQNYRMAVYPSMIPKTAATALHDHLGQFLCDPTLDHDELRSFIAVFLEPALPTEEQFDAALWELLQALHEEDVASHTWDSSVSMDPTCPHFSFSVHRRSFFLVSLQPGSSRFARRFPYVAITFNLHSQFEELRAKEQFADLRDQIRFREIQLQGSINPNVANFGEISEARQYSSLPKPFGYVCPFKPGEITESEG